LTTGLGEGSADEAVLVSGGGGVSSGIAVAGAAAEDAVGSGVSGAFGVGTGSMSGAGPETDSTGRSVSCAALKVAQSMVRCTIFCGPGARSGVMGSRGTA
jgi:hypothetical protein